MSGKILDALVAKNEFPILFIGSGISKRYLREYPSWEELLKKVWLNINAGLDFYAHMGTIRNELEESGITSDIEFNVYVKVAEEIEHDIKVNFFSEKMIIDGLTPEMSYKNNISPFKFLLSKIFSQNVFYEGNDEELVSFQGMLNKSQIILTTNYDSLIEEKYNEKSHYNLKTFIGQKGFFEQTPGYAELYKVHGCCTDSSSIVITESDYKKFDEDSILISAKIISTLLHSPIIFLGYSLTDRNIRKVIRDFVSSLGVTEKVTLEKRLIVIEWQKGNSTLIEEVVHDNDLGCRMTVIRTDNYKFIYDKISKINQGVAPSEIRRYHHVIKQLIIDRGISGTLDTVLLSPSDLDDIEELIGNKNLVVAVGDKAVIFQMPTIRQYVKEYFGDIKSRQNSETMMRYISTQGAKARLPFMKYLSDEAIDNSGLTSDEKRRLKIRFKEQTKIGNHLETILSSYCCTYDTLEKIKKLNLSRESEMDLVSFNYECIPSNELLAYVMDKLELYEKEGLTKLSTQFRRLSLVLDLKLHNEEIY
ncbi:SIR2-like domain-containing protein [Petrocella atlantisensis]|uniref:SIR2-like domain-containing protein n=1 Tax=Petrocella atlantisensis TaxID=2173034 RepID=A0A3P7RZC4_9FIRM|nr:SIR2 family protein [Petrocella atlantisensis]VDN47892.1 SIR2-like domain-containing protein [Petrocella atlantisensis]